jgi:AraC-like DNA-binding protein
VSGPASGQRIEAHRYLPPDDLADVVDTLWSGRWDLRGQAPHVTELLADPCMSLVCEGGGPHAGARAVGVWTELWKRELAGRGRVVGVKVRAGATQAFVTRPAHELANCIVALDEVVARPMPAEVLAADDDEVVFAHVLTWLRACRREEGAADVSLAVAVAQRIADDAEVTSVERLSEVAGIGARSLQRLFRLHVGASPKWLIRLHRLQEVALRIERGDHPTLASLAAELGYTDQAHLAHDLKSAVGKAPSVLAKTLREG